MRRSPMLALATVAVSLLVSTAGHAAAQTATYVTASAGVGFVRALCAETSAPLPPTPRNCPAGNIGYGGFIFKGTATAPTSVRIVDQAGKNQGITVCQDANGDLSCGGTDPVQRFCATGGTQALSGFKANIDTAVFVYGISTNCEGVGTTGTITLTNP